MSECEYCNKPVAPPLPIHPECGRIWLRGFHAREESERQDFVNKVIDVPNQKTMSERITDLDKFKGKTIVDAVEYCNNGIRIRFDDDSFAFLWPFAENDGNGVIHLDTNLSGVTI